MTSSNLFKSVLVLAAVLSFSSAFASSQVSESDITVTLADGTEHALEVPTIVVAGVAHKLVVKDLKSGQRYDSAHGYCVLKGYKYAMMTASTAQNQGPFAILDRAGKVIQTFGATGNDGRFQAAYSIQCE